MSPKLKGHHFDEIFIMGFLWQRPVQPVTEMSSKLRHSRLSGHEEVVHVACLTPVIWINSVAPEGCRSTFTAVFFFKLILRILSTSCQLCLRWVSLMTSQRTLVQAMARCRHYLCQCWPRFMSPYGVTRPHLYWNRLPLVAWVGRPVFDVIALSNCLEMETRYFSCNAHHIETQRVVRCCNNLT